MQMNDNSWLKNLKAGDIVFKVFCEKHFSGPWTVKEVQGDHIVVTSKNLRFEDHDFVYTMESGHSIGCYGGRIVQDSEEVRIKAEECKLAERLEGHILGVAHSHSFLCLKTKRLLDKVFEAVTVKPSGKTLEYKEICDILKNQMSADEEAREQWNKRSKE
jgi:hypothetical protein